MKDRKEQAGKKGSGKYCFIYASLWIFFYDKSSIQSRWSMRYVHARVIPRAMGVSAVCVAGRRRQAVSRSSSVACCWSTFSQVGSLGCLAIRKDGLDEYPHAASWGVNAPDNAEAEPLFARSLKMKTLIEQAQDIFLEKTKLQQHSWYRFLQMTNFW